ncbi:ABC transporter substrate-binding protein [Methanoregula sp.]|uniref:ABC transporter substrate-binding protein n=1 Tax=Methanoregula sp. TaxID=2052170 RepID=UPI00356B296B
MKTSLSLILLLAVLCLAAVPAQAAAPANTTAAFERTVTDDYGTMVTIHGEPQRIVSLAPTNTEILFALGLGDRVVGVTDYCNYPPEATVKPKIGGYSTVSVENVITQKPDLIVASYGNGAELVNHLKKLNLTVIVTNPENVSGILNDITFVGRATGADNNATALVDSLTARIRNTEKNASALTSRPKVAHILWNDPIYVSGNGTFQDELIRMAGGSNAFAGKKDYATIGTEDFIAANPDVLIVNSGSGMGGSEDSIAQYFKNETRFANVGAIKNHRVYVIDSDTVDRAGPRIVDALEIVAGDIRSADTGSPTATSSHAAPGFETMPALVALAAGIVIAARRMR